MRPSALVTLSVARCIGTNSALDESVMDFVRTTCLPEARYFRFEHTPIVASSVLLDTRFDEEKRRLRLLAWKKEGYNEARDLQYECQLPESLYIVFASQPEEQARG